VGTWSLGTLTADLTNSTDKAYAGAYLVKNSANPQPPTSGINPSQYLAGGNFRLFNDYGLPTGSTVQVGITPNPCGSVPIPNFLQTAQQSTYNGSTGTSPSGWKYQIAEGRVGAIGQTINQLLNGVTSTPWIWSAIEFNSSGMPMYSNVSIFPSFSVYLNGIYATTYNQSPVAIFSSLNASYQLTPSQIP
jgi:hypothetical protein